MKTKSTILVVCVLIALISSAQEVKVWPNTSITIHSGTTLDITSGDLVLKSDASGDASLIDYGIVTYSGGGEARVERYLTEGNWHLISSPVGSVQAGLFLGDYLQSHSEGSNSWTDIYSESYNLNVMQGYALWSVEGAPTTEVFSGTTNSGNLNAGFSENGNGWNLAGNPYPSAIDWDAVTIPAELNGAFWIFDPSIGANGDYLYYINGGGVANTTNQYIASGQGFFVRATGGAGSLSLTNNDRVHNAKPFFKDVQKDVLVLKVTGNEVTTQTAVRFNKNATLEADRLYDVFKIISDKPDVPNLFTRSGSEPMAINTLPSIEETEVVPAWFSAGLNGKYSISATEIGSFDPSVPLYLEDLETKTIQNLRDNPEYSFDYSSGADRQFLIWFADPAQSNNSTENAKVYANGNTLHVNFPVSELSNRDFSAQVYVYDVTGRLINKTDTRQINNQIQLSGEATIYLVSIVAGDIVTNTKVFNN